MAYSTAGPGYYKQATQPDYSQNTHNSHQPHYPHQSHQSNQMHQEHRSHQPHQPTQHNLHHTWNQGYPRQSNHHSQPYQSHQVPHPSQVRHPSQVPHPSQAPHPSHPSQPHQAPQGSQPRHRPPKQKKSVTYLNHRAPGLSDASLHQIPMPDPLAHAWGVSPERMPPLPTALRAGASSEGYALRGSDGYAINGSHESDAHGGYGSEVYGMKGSQGWSTASQGYGQKNSRKTLKVMNPEPEKKDKGKGKEKGKSAVNEHESFDSNSWGTAGTLGILGFSGPHGNAQASNQQNQQNHNVGPTLTSKSQSGQAPAAFSSNPLNGKHHPLPPVPSLPGHSGHSGIYPLPAPARQPSHSAMTESERKWKARMDANDYPIPPQLQALGKKGTTQQVKQTKQTKQARQTQTQQVHQTQHAPTQQIQQVYHQPRRYPPGLPIPQHLQAPTQQAQIQQTHQTQYAPIQQTQPAHQPHRYPPGLPIPPHLQQHPKLPPGLAYNGYEQFQTPTPGSLWGPSSSGDKGGYHHGTFGSAGQGTGTVTQDQDQGKGSQLREAQGQADWTNANTQGQGAYTNNTQQTYTNHKSQQPNSQRPFNLAAVVNDFSHPDGWPSLPQTRYSPEPFHNPHNPTQQIPAKRTQPAAVGPSGAGTSHLTRPPIHPQPAHHYPQSSAFTAPGILTLPYNPHSLVSTPSQITSGGVTVGQPTPTPDKILCPRPMKIAKMPSEFTLKKQWKEAGWIEDDGLEEGPRKRKLKLWTQQGGWVEVAGDDDEEEEEGRDVVTPRHRMVQQQQRGDQQVTQQAKQWKPPQDQQANQIVQLTQQAQKWTQQHDQQLKWNGYGQLVDQVQDRPEVQYQPRAPAQQPQLQGNGYGQLVNQVPNRPEPQHTQQPQPPRLENFHGLPQGQEARQTQKLHDLEQVVISPLEQGRKTPLTQRNPLATYVHQVHPVYQPPPAKPEQQYQKYPQLKTAKPSQLRKPLPPVPQPIPQAPSAKLPASQPEPRRKMPKIHRVQLHDNPVSPFFDLPKPPAMSSMLPWNFGCPPSGLYFDLPLYPASFLPNAPISSLKTGDKIVVENRLSYFSHYDHRRQRAVVIDFERMMIRSGRAKLHQKVHVADVEYVDCEVTSWQLHFNCLQLDTTLFAKPVYIARNKHLLESQLVGTLQEVKNGKRMRIWLAVWMDYAFVLGWNVPGSCLLRHSIGSMGQKAQWYWHCCGDRDQKIVEESALKRIPKQNGDFRWCGWCAGVWKR